MKKIVRSLDELDQFSANAAKHGAFAGKPLTVTLEPVGDSDREKYVAEIKDGETILVPADAQAYKRYEAALRRIAGIQAEQYPVDHQHCRVIALLCFAAPSLLGGKHGSK